MNAQLKDFVQVNANRLKKKIYKDDSIHIPDFDKPEFLHRDDMLEYYLLTFKIDKQTLLKSRKSEITDLKIVISNDLRQKGYSLKDIGYILHKSHDSIIYYLKSRGERHNQKLQQFRKLLK